MLRNIIAVIVGLLTGMIVHMALLFLNTTIFPLPEGISMMDPEASKDPAFIAYVANMPAMGYIGVMIAHLSQTFIGGLVVGRMARSHHIVLAMVIGVLTLIGGVVNLIDLPHPWWMWLEVPLYLITAWYGAKRTMRDRTVVT